MQEIGKYSDSNFFDRDVQEVSKDLLGRVLEHLVDGIWLSVRIIETEAYYGQGNLLKGIDNCSVAQGGLYVSYSKDVYNMW